MRRLSLSTKLFAAALPLVLAVAALLALTVREDLKEVDDAERGATLGEVWTPLVNALTSVEAELGQVDAAAAAQLDGDEVTALNSTRRVTDQALNELNEAVADLGAAEAARKHITQSRSSLSGGRRAIDTQIASPGTLTEVDPLVSFDVALRELVSIGQLLPAESGDPTLGRDLLAVVKLAEGRVAADAVSGNVESWQIDPLDGSPLATARVRLVEMESVLNEFAAIAPEEWARDYRQSGMSMSLAQYRSQLDLAARAAERGEVGEFDLEGFSELSDESLALQTSITSSIVDRAQAQADDARQSTLVRSAIALAAVVLAMIIAWLLTRSVTSRVRAVSRSAHQVATQQLPSLVEALRDPRGKAVLPAIEPVSTRGSDELAELAQAFNSMQATLVDVAQEQVDVLRRGVSDIFVTMARRNRSLIDRQLAMLDEFEAEVDDPDVLSNYYQLDHMATRMRRNSESLLVLANAEPKRRRVKATEIDDVVRAAIGEVEDYRRIEIEALESLQVRGNVVADISHLLAELLDNATAFSPPDSVVRIGGRRAGDSYMLRIVDNGVGIGIERLRELNDLLREPPIVGLSVEPTLGMSVVSLLAHRHGVSVTLSQGSPGTTVDVLLPSSLFGPIDSPINAPVAPVAEAASVAAPPSLTDLSIPVDMVDQIGGPDHPEQVLSWSAENDVDFEQYERQLAAEFEIAPPVVTTDKIAEAEAEATGDAPITLPAGWGSSLDFDSLRDEPSQPLDYGIADETDAPDTFTEPNEYDLADSTDGMERPFFQPSSEWNLADLTAEPVPAPEPTPASDPQPVADFGVPGEPFTLSPPLPTRQPAAVDLPPPPPVAEPMPEPIAEPVAEVADEAAVEADVEAAVEPAPVAYSGEFDRPVAPPLNPSDLTRRPVAPVDAHPVARLDIPDPTPTEPLLPTRARGEHAPDGGPDRLAAALGNAGAPATESEPVAATSSPSALQNALAAFDSRRNGGGSLPTRSRTSQTTASATLVDTTSSTTQSRLDPETLRERLRAFQNEFRIATDSDRPNQSNNPSSTNDLGGDPR